MTIRDRAGDIVYANSAALASMGFDTLEQLQSRSSRSIMGDYIVEDEHGKPLKMEDVPSMKLVHDEPAEPLLMRTISRQSGAVSWRLLKATPLHDESGNVVAAVTVIEDVTAVKEAELRTRLLAESGRILASSLDYEQTLENVANLAVPTLADWCAVDLVNENLQRDHVVTAHRDPEKRELANRLRAFDPSELDPEQAVARVVRTGTPELYAEITDDQLVQSARSQEHLRLLRELEMRSVVIVPLQVPLRTIGVMTLVTAESRRRLTQEDLELAAQLGRRAAVAVENARLHTTLAAIAETLQKGLLPDELPEVPGWELASMYRPAGSDQRIDVGGDFYEVFEDDRGWFALIGDVTGKGVAAAALTALMRHGARFASRLEPEPAAILARLDEALRQQSGDSMCTALCVRLHDHRLEMSSGGHPPGLIVRRDGQIRECPDAGPLLGAFDDAQWPQRTALIDSDELVLLYTDGVTETAGERERFGIERLRNLLAENAEATPAELLEALDASLEAFRNDPRRDDVAALAMRPRPGAGERSPPPVLPK